VSPLEIASGVKKTADLTDDLAALYEGSPYLLVDDEVDVALAESGLDIGEAVPLLRQR